MDMDLDVDCPECGRSMAVTLAEISAGATKRCPAGHSVRLVDDGGGAQRASRALDNLDKTLKNFGK